MRRRALATCRAEALSGTGAGAGGVVQCGGAAGCKMQVQGAGCGCICCSLRSDPQPPPQPQHSQHSCVSCPACPYPTTSHLSTPHPTADHTALHRTSAPQHSYAAILITHTHCAAACLLRHHHFDTAAPLECLFGHVVHCGASLPLRPHRVVAVTSHLLHLCPLLACAHLWCSCGAALP